MGVHVRAFLKVGTYGRYGSVKETYRICHILRSVHKDRWYACHVELERHLAGQALWMDPLHIPTGQYSSMSWGKVTYALQMAEPAVMDLLEKTFATSYYSAVLAVTTDNCLVPNLLSGGSCR